MADKVAQFGGSWVFIGLFALVMVTWVILNSVILVKANKSFDPYPYILLNLFLSMLAAIQAPIILMSQNRQAYKDRMSAEHDYEVNLKAELEIWRCTRRSTAQGNAMGRAHIDAAGAASAALRIDQRFEGRTSADGGAGAFRSSASLTSPVASASDTAQKAIPSRVQLTML
jgi:hypothetical protein